MQTSISCLLLAMALGMSSLVFSQNINHEVTNETSSQSFPRIWVNGHDKKRILDNIQRYQWAKSLKQQLEKRVNPYSERHKHTPEFLLSRIPRTWNGNHYTDVTIGQNPDHDANDLPQGAPFRTSGRAPIPTLHRSFDFAIRSKTGKPFVAPKIDDLPPYNADPFYGMTLKVAGTQSTEYVPYLARHLRTVYTDILALGTDSAVLYYLTGKQEYAQLAADILWAFVEPLHYMNSVRTPRSHASGMIITNYLRDARITMPLFPVIYDLIHDYLNHKQTRVFDAVSKTRKPFDDQLAQEVFAKLAKITLDKGIVETNWSILEGDAILNNLLVIKDKAKREALFEQFFVKGTANHDAFLWSLDNFTSENIWPESILYAFDVSKRILSMMDTLGRNQALLGVDVFSIKPSMLDGPFVFHNMEYPNQKMMTFGDSVRTVPAYYDLFQVLASAAVSAKRPDYVRRAKNFMAYIQQKGGDHRPSIQTTRLGYTSPLNLLRGVDLGEVNAEEKGKKQTVRNAEPLAPEKLTSLHISHGGIVMQRNYHTPNVIQNGLMYYTGGATYVHAHASGLDMELYGAGMVMAPDFGSGGYGKPVHNTYAVNPASHNTVIINGQAKWGDRSKSWKGVMNNTQLLALEPKPNQQPLSDKVSFSCQSLNDTYNKGQHQRCVTMIRTGPDSGYYLDVFRAQSTDATQYSDYLYHNLGDHLQVTKLDGQPVTLKSAPQRYQSRTQDKYQEPGWHWFKQVQLTEPNSDGFKVRFSVDDTNVSMFAYIPASHTPLELSVAKGPSTPGVSFGYDKKPTQVMTLRRYGSAWQQPYAVVYEPTVGAGSKVLSTYNLEQGEQYLGTVINSQTADGYIQDIIIVSDEANSKTHIEALGISFTGRMAMVRRISKHAFASHHSQYGLGQDDSLQGSSPEITKVLLYIGDGKKLGYQGHTLETGTRSSAIMER